MNKLISREKKILILAALAVIFVIGILTELTWLACIAYGCAAIYFAFKNDKYTILAFLIAAVLQNMVLIIFSDHLTPVYHIVLSAIKEGMIYLAVLFSLIKIIKKGEIAGFLKKNLLVIVLLGLLVLILIKNIIISESDISSEIVALRQLVLPFLLILFGFHVNIGKEEVVKIKRYIIVLGILLTVFGVIEMALPGNIIWKCLKYGDFLRNKQNGIVNLYEGVTRNFYTWDLGFLMRRLVSFTADPLATAHLIFLGLGICLCSKAEFYKKLGYKYWIIAAVLFIGCVLGFSKGSFIYMALLLGALLYDRLCDKVPQKVWIAVCIAIVFIFGGFIIYSYVTADKPTAIVNHVSGLLLGLKNSTLWGKGLGTAGWVNSVITGASIYNSESFFGIVLYQIGWCGMLILVIFWISLLCRFFKQYRKGRNKNVLFGLIILVGLTVDMILSESSVSAMGTGIYFILIGVIYRLYVTKTENDSMQNKAENN